MSQKIKITLGAVLVLGLIVAILLNNKSKMQAKSKNDDVHVLPVTVFQVDKHKLSETLSLTGTIAANNDVAVISETQGRITKVFAKVGDQVEAGSPIVQLDDELKHAAYVTAEVNYEKAKKDFERHEKLLEDKSISNTQFEGARLALKSAEAQFIVARRQYNDTKIKTPISGVVTSRPVDVGTMVQNNMVVANVVDISKLKVKLNISERDAFRLKVGDKVEVSTDVYQSVKFDGTIESISAKGDEAHTYPVEVLLVNSSKYPLKAGMFARMTFLSIKDEESLTIPRQALVGSLKKPQVFVVQSGVAKLRTIVVGREIGTSLEILSGLTQEEEVVLSGQNNLKDNAIVTVVK